MKEYTAEISIKDECLLIIKWHDYILTNNRFKLIIENMFLYIDDVPDQFTPIHLEIDTQTKIEADLFVTMLHEFGNNACNDQKLYLLYVNGLLYKHGTIA